MVLTSSCITCLCKDIKKNLSTCFNGQIVTKLLIGILFTITLASCNGSLINPFVKSDTPTPIPNPHSRPEPHEPIVTGTYSGLSDNELVRLYIRGTGGIQGTQPIQLGSDCRLVCGARSFRLFYVCLRGEMRQPSGRKQSMDSRHFLQSRLPGV